MGRDRSRTAVRAIASALRDPVAVILYLAGIFDWLSDNPVHSLVLFGAATALVWDSLRRRHATSGTVDASVTSTAAAVDLAIASSTSRPWTAAFGCFALVFAFFVGGFGRFSWPATVFVIVLGAVAIALAWGGPLHPTTEPEPLEPLGVLAWSSVFLSLAIWELVQLLLQPSLTTDSYAHPTISVTMDPILAHHPGRTVAMCFWLIGGWFLVQR